MVIVIEFLGISITLKVTTQEKTYIDKNLVINALNIDFLPRCTFLLTLKNYTLRRSKEIASLHYLWISS